MKSVSLDTIASGGIATRSFSSLTQPFSIKLPAQLPQVRVTPLHLMIAGAFVAAALSPFAVSAGRAMLVNYSVPEACYAWYDGCNMCQKTADGVVTCTHRMCQHYGKGFCKMRLSS